MVKYGNEYSYKDLFNNMMTGLSMRGALGECGHRFQIRQTVPLSVVSQRASQPESPRSESRKMRFVARSCFAASSSQKKP